MLGLLQLWVLWRIARVLVLLLIVIALLGALAASIHRQPVISAPRALSPLTTILGHHADQLISQARRDLTHALAHAPR